MSEENFRQAIRNLNKAERTMDAYIKSRENYLDQLLSGIKNRLKALNSYARTCQIIKVKMTNLAKKERLSWWKFISYWMKR